MNMHQILNIALALFAAGVSIPFGIKVNRELRAERKQEAEEDAAIEAEDAEEAEDAMREVEETLSGEFDDTEAEIPAVNVVVPHGVTIH